MPVHVAVKRFLTAIAHLHGSLGAQCQHARMNLHAEILAGAEGATNPRQMQPDFFRRQVEAGGKLLQVRVQPLGGDEQVDAAVRGRHRQPGFGTERGLVLHAGLVGALHPHIGASVRVAVNDLERADDVALRMD